jgi:hypothetical protein
MGTSLLAANTDQNLGDRSAFHHVANNKKNTMLDTTTRTTTAAAADGELQKGNSTTIADWEKDEPAATAAANPNIDMITSSKFTYEELKKIH